MARPLAMALGAIVSLALLAWIGRPTSTALASMTTDATTTATLSAPLDDASTPLDAPISDALAAEADAAPMAVQSLVDGGVLVDLNLANEEELRKLPGIGPTRAKAIVELRRRLGRIRSVDDLARIKGLGRALIRKLRPMTIATAKP